MSSPSLQALAPRLRQTLGLLHKQDIQTASKYLGSWAPAAASHSSIQVGDDCAAIPDGDGFLLLAAEGLWPTLVQADPWFAGWCAVLVNVSDVFAMGGWPIAVVDALWSGSAARAAELWAGMVAASKAFNVPIVGGHTNCQSPYEALSVAILGRANRLLTSFDARPGDWLVLVADFDGRPHPDYPFWDAATHKSPEVLRSHLQLLPQLAEARLCDTAKDISMGGIVGTALMLIETSGCGAILDLEALPCPPQLSLDQWLISFPSYGFLLSLRPESLDPVKTLFQSQGLVCEAVGPVIAKHQLILKNHQEAICLWDLDQTPLTGFSRP